MLGEMAYAHFRIPFSDPFYLHCPCGHAGLFYHHYARHPQQAEIPLDSGFAVAPCLYGLVFPCLLDRRRTDRFLLHIHVAVVCPGLVPLQDELDLRPFYRPVLPGAWSRRRSVGVEPSRPAYRPVFVLHLDYIHHGDALFCTAAHQPPCAGLNIIHPKSL